MAQLKITLVKSLIGSTDRQRATAASLGLKRTNSFVIQEDRPEILGKIDKLSHLLKVEKLEA